MRSATAAAIWRGHTLAILMFKCMVGGATMEWARDLFRWAGHDAWISVLLAGTGALVSGSLVFCAVALYPEARPGSVMVAALGSWMGGILSLGFVFYTLAEAARVGRTTVELLHFAVLQRTPDWILLALGLLITATLLVGGGEPLFRYLFTLFWPTVFLHVVLIGLGLRFGDWANFLPVLSQGPAPVIRATGALIEPVLGVELGLVYLPYFFQRGVRTASGLYAVWGGIAAALSLYLYLTVALLVGFGPFETALLTWPMIEVVRRTYLAGLFFERLDILFLITLLTAASSALSLYTYAGLETVRKICAARPRAWQVWAFVLAVWGIALVPTNLTHIDWWRTQVLQPLGFVYLVPIPLLLIGAGLIRRYRRRRRA